MNTETKYRVASCLVVMSLISCSMSLIALYIAIPQIPNNTYDYNGTLVTILSVLVTLLLGWNIYTVVDFNRKVEKAEEKVGEEIEVIKAESQKLKDDYLELENSLKYMQSDITFTSVFNYAMKIDKETTFVQYAIDGYIDALNVAIKDGLNKDRIDVVVDSLFTILDKPNDSKSLILPNMTNVYYSVVSEIPKRGASKRTLGDLILKFTEEEYIPFPSGYVHIMSDYHPDFIQQKHS